MISFSKETVFITFLGHILIHVFNYIGMFFIKKHCKCLVLSSMAVAKDAHEFYDIEFSFD